MKNMELPFIKDMFESIAPRYDLLNRLLSLRQDVYWRRVMISQLEKLHSESKVLDVACGTCDVGLELFKQKDDPSIQIIGTDFSTNMLKIAQRKISLNPKSKQMHLLTSNALALPLKKDTFDAVTIAFGIRNIADKAGALENFNACLKTNGILIILELTTPTIQWFRSLYLMYFKYLLPVVGWFFSKNIKAYQYLPHSVLNFPESDRFARMMRRAGFANVKWKPMTLGIATLFVGFKQ